MPTKLLLIVLVLAAGAGIWMYLERDEGDDGQNDKAGRDMVAGEKEDPAAVLERLAPLLQQGGKRPPVELLETVRAEDIPTLVKEIGRDGDLVRKRSLVWTLGFKGGEAATGPLTALLENDYAKEALPRGTEDVLFEAIQAIGLAAAHDPKAYRFAVNATDPAFWEKQRSWSSARGDHGIHMLVSYSLHAVGMSGRPESKADIAGFQKRGPYYVHRWGGDITEAAFYRWLRKTKGEAILKEYVLTPPEHCRACTSREATTPTNGASCGHLMWTVWQDSAEGKKWIAWANEKTRGPRPAKPD